MNLNFSSTPCLSKAAIRCHEEFIYQSRFHIDLEHPGYCLHFMIRKRLMVMSCSWQCLFQLGSAHFLDMTCAHCALQLCLSECVKYVLVSWRFPALCPSHLLSQIIYNKSKINKILLYGLHNISWLYFYY